MSVKKQFSDLLQVAQFDATTLSTIQNICLDADLQLSRLDTILGVTPANKLAYTTAKKEAIEMNFLSLLERVVNHVINNESIDDVYNSIDIVIAEINALVDYLN